MTALQLSIQIVIYIAIGVFARKLKVIGEGFDKSLSGFIVNFALPCMIIHSLSLPYSPDELANFPLLLGLAILVCALLLGVGHLFYLGLGKTDVARVDRFGIYLSNFTFMGLPMVDALYGQEGLFYFVIFTAPIRVLYYSLVGPLLSPAGTGSRRRSRREVLKQWLNPPLAGVVVGLILYFTGLRLPGVLTNVVDGLSDVCSPMGMVLCGITIGKYNLRSLVRPKYLRLPLLRDLLAPAVTLAVLWLLPIDPMIKKVVVLYAALPCAGMLATYTIQFNPNPEARLEASSAILLSTLLSVATIPLWAAVLDRVF